MSSNPPPLYDHEVNIYLPDGQFYSGGNITETKVIHDTLNNLYADVEENGALMGIPHECRCVFVRNDSDTAKTAKITAWIEANTPNPFSNVLFGIGGAGVNAAEVELGTPFSVPPNVNFIDITSKPSEPQILELEPHQYFAIWFDWQTLPNAPSYVDDFFILSVEVERVPLPDTGVSITCPEGQILDPSTGQCVPVITCGEGEEYDPVSGDCVPIGSIPTCPSGQHWNPTLQQCVDDVVNPPPSGTVNNVTIVAGGDWDCTNDTDDVVDTILFLNPDLLLGLGDYSYRSSQDCFINRMQRITKLYPSKMKMVIGNHDDTEDGSAQNRQEIITAFGMPSAGYYSFTVENIRFIAIDTQKSRSVGSAQYNFVLQELQAAESDPNIRWKVVFYHKPSVTTDGDHHGADSAIETAMHPLFDQYHVNVVIAGHNHNFSCTYLINHSVDVDVQTVVDDSSVYNNLNGTVFVTAGCAGTDLRDTGSLGDHIAYANDQDFGIFRLSLSNNGTILMGSFVDTGRDIPYSFVMQKPS